MLSVILVNYNEREYLKWVLEMLPEELVGLNPEIIVIDNQSKDGSADLVRSNFPKVRLIGSGGNLMYGKGNNLGIQAGRGEWFLIINPDIRWEPGQLHAFVTEAMTKPNLGAAGPKVLGPDGRVQRSAHHTFPSIWTVFVDYCLPLQQILLRTPRHPSLSALATQNQTVRVAHLTGVCLLIPRAVIERTKGFDPEFTMYLEETEWQQRMSQAGFAMWYLGTHTITHFGSAEKRFAQASPHYLWGLWHYTEKHWGAAAHARLLLTIWLATIISFVFLLPGWIVSWTIGRPGARIRHYLRQYGRLLLQLAAFPNHPPRP